MSGIYIHIPFCQKRCIYCDFFFITNLKLKEKFLHSLIKEIELSSSLYSAETFDTIFFGGGTPSLLTTNDFNSILNSLTKNFKLNSKLEISIEANPEDFHAKNFRQYSELGINRISFGIQSLNNSELKFLSRTHTAEEAESVIKKTLDIFNNISVDLIYSLPNQKLSDIDYSLRKVLEFDIPHISAYNLTIEPKTILNKMYEKNIDLKNPDNIEAKHFKFISNKLTSLGYTHYEVSNYSKKGFECKHNLKYWGYKNYVGFGPSAHSFHNGVRWNNIKNVSLYNNSLQKNLLPIENEYILSIEDKKLEFIMLSLRSSGVNFDEFKNLFNQDFKHLYQSSIRELIKKKFAKINNKNFSLTLDGFLLADEIISRYF